MNQADAKCRQGSASDRFGVAMRVRLGMGSGPLFMQMGVDVRYSIVPVNMGVKIPSLPAQKQPDGEDDNDGCDGQLGAAMDCVREVLPKDDNWEPEQKKSGSVAQSPGRAEPPGMTGTAGAVPEDQGRYCGNVVRVGGMPEPKEQGDQEDAPGAAPQLADPLINSLHEVGRVNNWDQKNRGGKRTRPFTGLRRVGPLLEGSTGDYRA
jgi:hypothetical protein